MGWGMTGGANRAGTRPGQPAAVPNETDAAIGEAMQRLRTERGLSLRTFAASAGFSASFVSQVENGQTSPSIASLERLARALGLGLTDFFSRLAAEPALVMRRAERRRFTSEWSRARLEPLVPPEALRSLEGVLITLEGGGRSGKDASVQPHEQLALVLEGEIALTIGRASHVLGVGDAAAIPSNCPHAWENRAASPARVAIVAARHAD